MDFSEHLALSAAGSAVLLLATGSPAAALAFSVAGVLVDADHVPDYWRETGVNFRRQAFLDHFSVGRPRHLLVPLHGWEWPLALGAASLALALPGWVAAAAAGWLFHLALDQRYNPLGPYSYFFFYRWRVGFDSDAIFDSAGPGA
ncbi:MAG TPA: hypothetical protein VNZ54_02715 [bacterium]|nr:hypothetical protein [bacterium]